MTPATRTASRSESRATSRNTSRGDTRHSPGRIQDLESVLENFEQVHIEWVEADNRPDPDSTYWDAVELLIDTFDEGDMPSAMRKMNELVQQLSAELVAFDHRDDQETQVPEESFFAAVEAIFNARKHAVMDSEPRRIESIKDLMEQKVTMEQIARMYGFVDRFERPEVWKVREELDKPGTHVNESWVNPSEKKRLRQLEDQQQRREDAVSNGMRRKLGKSRAPCPETCQQLWMEGVSAEQAAKMLGRPLREIDQEYRDFEEERAERSEEGGSMEDEVAESEDGADNDTDIPQNSLEEAAAMAKQRRVQELTGGRGRRGRNQGSNQGSNQGFDQGGSQGGDNAAQVPEATDDEVRAESA